MKRICCSLLALAALWSPASGQDIGRNGRRMLELFAPVVKKPSAHVVRVRCGGKDVALGTIVSADGWVLTKASELKGDRIVCRLSDGRDLKAKLVRSDEKYDLAALKVEAKGLPAVTWADSKAAPVGRWVACPGTGRLPVAIGVVGVAARKLKGGPPNPDGGFLGIGFDLDFAGVKVGQVSPGSPAEKAGLKTGDQIVWADGEKPEDADDFVALVQRHKPGDVLALKVERDGKERELKVKLAKRPGGRATKLDVQDRLGSALSGRRSGFPMVLQHDCVLKPGDCGGPLVDLEGRAVGLNIARAGRTETYAIPGEVVRELLPGLTGKNREKGKP